MKFDGLKRPTTRTLAAELEYLAPPMKIALLAAVKAYRETGVRFALCGGLAASVYGEPRATRDIDFLVGDEAFIKRGTIVTFAHPFPLQVEGVAIDAIPLPENSERALQLNRALMHCNEDTSLGVPVPILAPADLAYMKLLVGRSKDIADVVAMLESGAIDEEDLWEAAGDDEHVLVMAEVAVEEWHGDGGRT